MEKFYFEFEINNNDRFSKLQDFFYALKEEKAKDNIISKDSKWIGYFEEDVLMKFWWPTSDELNEYAKLWKERA